MFPQYIFKRFTVEKRKAHNYTSISYYKNRKMSIYKNIIRQKNLLFCKGIFTVSSSTIQTGKKRKYYISLQKQRLLIAADFLNGKVLYNVVHILPLQVQKCACDVLKEKIFSRNDTIRAKTMRAKSFRVRCKAVCAKAFCVEQNDPLAKQEDHFVQLVGIVGFEPTE